jgi:succinoglycan biosynthesis protein ExoM
LLGVTICICSIRTALIRATLLSVAELTIPDDVTLCVNIIDNTVDHDLAHLVRDPMLALPFRLRIIHAPHSNISIARNAALDSCANKFLCFIDDDELARPDWLVRLFEWLPGYQAVFGPALAQFPQEHVPRWMVHRDYHSDLITDNDPPWKGMSCNVMLDMDFVRAHDLRFREDLGQTGGEDTIFFLTAYRLGARFSYVPDAIVDAPVAPPRLKLLWLLRRRFRNGQVHAIALRELGGHRSGVWISTVKTLASLVLSIANGFRPSHAVPHLLRVAFHTGVISRLMGAEIYREYAPSRRT